MTAENDPDEADATQNWKGMDGAIAYHLIDRQAESWGEIGAMMNAWLRANGGTVASDQSEGETDTDALVEAVKQAANALDSAADDIDDWGNYASEYFKEKHGLKADVMKYKELAFKLRMLVTPNVKVSEGE